jgi:hypothetical protein
MSPFHDCFFKKKFNFYPPEHGLRSLKIHCKKYKIIKIHFCSVVVSRTSYSNRHKRSSDSVKKRDLSSENWSDRAKSSEDKITDKKKTKSNRIENRRLKWVHWVGKIVAICNYMHNSETCLTARLLKLLISRFNVKLLIYLFGNSFEKIYIFNTNHI